MLAKSLRLIWRQMNVQFRLRALSGYSMLLLIIQPAIFSGIGFILARVAGKEAPDLIYTIIGGGFMGLWSSILFTSFYDITNDRVEGTLELIVGSPTSLTKILAIRTLTNVLTGMISLSCSFLIALAFFGYKFNAESLPAVGVSVLVIMLTFWCLGLLLANFHAWSRVSGTAVNYLELPIAVVCGFMFPVSILPAWLSPFSRFCPCAGPSLP